MADKTISQTTPLYDLVVIGCSAGGIEALSRLTATLPPDFPAPMVVAQHLDPARPSHLGAILAHHSTLRVQTLSDETDETAEPASITMTPGVVYIVPADRDVEILDGAVRLCTTASRHPKPSIDRLFTSAAAAYGERLIAVILTGTGSDGTAGARAVKAAGGLVVIENPATASYPSMPAALAATTVDLVADLGDIGGLLDSLLTGGYTPAEPEASTVLPALLARVREHSGIDFSQYKHPTILRRLQRRMVAVGTASIAEYSDYVQRHPDEYARLVASFLIQVTEFFRDAELVRYLREQLLPDLVAYARAHAGEHGAELRIWSAGCASGEEAYSLAILLAEVLCGDEVDGVHVRIFATDVDANAVAFARRGVYPAAAVVSIPPDLLARYFTPVDDGFAVTKRIRSMIIFGEHDLGQRAPFPQIDLVLCRNVLIYFTTELQRRALQLFAFALREDGRLVLGNAETTSPLHDAFVPDHPQFKIYRRHGDRVLVPPARMADLAPPILPVWRSLHLDTRTDTRTNMRTLDARTGEQTRRQLAPHFGSAPTPPSTQPHRSPTSTSTSTSTSARDADVSSVPDLHSISQRLRTSTDALGGIVLGLPIGVVMLDRHFDVQTINSPAYHLLGIYRGALGEDLLHVAKSVPAEVLRSALEAAFRSTPSDVSTGGEQSILVQTTTGEPRTLRLTCYPHFGGVQDRGTQDGRIPVDSGIPVGSAQERASPDQYADQYADRVERRVDERAREEESAPRQDGGHGHDGARRPERELATHVLLLVAGVTTAEQAERTRRSEEDDAAPATGPLRQTGKHEVEQEVERLRHELAQVSAINRELREANQDLTAANLRVQRVNEALVVREEEAQAASEEVKTLNEELQATNEELETLNEEMEATVEELHATNDDVQARARELQELAEEREQQRQASERDRAQLEAILLSMGDALVVVDASGEVRITNTAYEALLGRDASDVVLRDALGEPLSPEATPLARAAERAPFTMQFTLSAPGGTPRWFEAHGQPIRDVVEMMGSVVTIRDISERSLRLLQEQFVSLVIHELRAPLTSIQAALQLLMRSLGPTAADDRNRSLMGLALRQAIQLRAMISDLLDLGRVQQGKLRLQLEPVDLSALLRQLVDMMNVVQTADERSQSSEPQQPIVFHLAPRLAAQPVMIAGDSIRIEQMVINLLTNARKYAPSSPQVDVRLRPIDTIDTIDTVDTVDSVGDGGQDAISRQNGHDGMVEVQVQDYGPGIPAGDLPRIFSAFYQVERSGAAMQTGVGLGLYVTRQLVEAHGGTINVHSDEGVGTTFTIRFPLLSTSTTGVDRRCGASHDANGERPNGA